MPTTKLMLHKPYCWVTLACSLVKIHTALP